MRFLKSAGFGELNAMIPRKNNLDNQQGFAYLFVLLAVMLIGIMLGAVGTSWKLTMQREREQELLFRGMQIQDAISRWHSPKSGVQQHVATPLNDLKDLLQDPRTPATVRYLRKLYRDPITNQDWTVIRETAHGIVGVASASKDTVIKQDNFPDQLQDFNGKQRYDQWQFVYKPAQNKPKAAVVTGGA
jgi:type II secretory pathway pseudopilin PulG